MGTEDLDNVTKVKVAKITATQTIVVALITTIGGGLIGFFVSSNKFPAHTASEHKQSWLVIHRIDDQAHRHVRIVASANGINYSYPSRAVWAETGPQMSSERFPLQYSKTYRVAFSAFVTNPGASDTDETVSQEVEVISESQIPTGQKLYELYPLDRGYRGATPSLSVVYSIDQ